MKKKVSCIIDFGQSHLKFILLTGKFKVARTNFEAVKNIQDLFPEMKVMGFELFKSDENKDDNTLHLDCCFQPVGKNMAILHKAGFLIETEYEWLRDFF